MRLLRFRIHFLIALFVVLLGAGSLFAQNAPDGQEGGGGRRGAGFGAFAGGGGVHGSVTAISGSEITVKDEQGETYKVATGPNTRLMKDRQPIKAADIKVGDVVVTGGEVDDKAHTVGAVFLAVLDAEQVQRMKQAQADFGKTWTAGKITAINDLALTIERPDKKTQVIVVDENTSFHKHRDAITLADIKVGDTVSARGALKGDNFAASTLAVMEPRQGNPGQGRTTAPGSAPPPQQP